MRLYGVMWGHMVSCGVILEHIGACEPNEIMWDHVVSCGDIWDRVDHMGPCGVML